MPTYQVDVPGQGTYEFDAQNEMSDDEAYNHVLSQIGGGDGSASPPAAQQPRDQGFYEKLFSQSETSTDPLARYAGITGRRAGSALDALIGIPSSIGDLVTGGREGRLGAALNLIQGIASPFSAALAPVEAAGEQLVSGVTGSEHAGRLAGDIVGAAAPFGLGYLSKAGKLGEGLESYAKFLGVGRPKTFEEMVTRDPQMRWVAERPLIDTSTATELEKLARSEASIDELALQLGRPEMARMGLIKKEGDDLWWREMAKQNIVQGEMPPEPQLISTDGIIFDKGSDRDINLIQSLGTPATRASAIDPQRAGAVAMETNEANFSLKRAIDARVARNEGALEGLSDADAQAGVLMKGLMNQGHFTAEEIANLPEDQLKQSSKNLVDFLNKKFNVDVEIAIPRIREQARQQIAKTVRAELGEGATETDMIAEVNKRLDKAIPTKMSYDQAALNLFPGNYHLYDTAGNVLGVFQTPLEWKMKVKELVDSGLFKANELKVDAQAYLDTDLLSAFRGRTKRNMKHLVSGLTPSADEVQAAANGDWSFAKAWSMLTPFTDKGNPKGFVNELKDMLSTYDRSFERWLQVNDLLERTAPDLKNIRERGYPKLAEDLLGNIKALWGHRMPGSAYLDNLVAATPLLRDIAAPNILERWSQAGKTFLVNALLKFNPRFQAVNATQTLSTLWPIADMSEIMDGLKLMRSEGGKALLERHIGQPGSVVEGFAKGLGPTESFNQNLAFSTMYNRARKLGFTDAQAAAYGRARGNLYSQFTGLVTDQPIAFRKLDPLGTFTMFQRFPVKQTEMLIDLMKDKDFPGVAKWLGVQLALGGFKAATMGSTGWLTYKIYKDIEDKYGKGVADVFHTGLPALLGADLSSSVQLYNPPFGDSFGERLSNFAQGPLLGIGTSTIGQLMNTAAADPNAARRAVHQLSNRNPFAKLAYQIFAEPDTYDFRDPSGRLKFKGDMKDLIKTGLGFRTAGGQMGVMQGPNQMREAELDTFVDAFMEVNQKRGDVLDYAASRWGQAMAAGIDLGKDMQSAVEKEVNSWNNLWPEFPITNKDIMDRAKRRRDAVVESMGQRMLKNVPAVVKNSPVFQATPDTTAPVAPPPGLPFEFFGGG